MTRRHTMHRGWTLVELVVVITVSTLLMGVALTLLATLLRHRDASTQGRQFHVSLLRLSEQFRADVQASHSVEEEPAPNGESSARLVCHLPGDQTAGYQWIDNRIVRIGSGEDNQSSRESFALRSDTTVAWNVQAGPPSSVAELTLDYPIRGQLSRRRELSIVAAVGRDLRWTSAQEPPATAIQPNQQQSP